MKQTGLHTLENWVNSSWSWQLLLFSYSFFCKVSDLGLPSWNSAYNLQHVLNWHLRQLCYQLSMNWSMAAFGLPICFWNAFYFWKIDGSLDILLPCNPTPPWRLDGKQVNIGPCRWIHLSDDYLRGGKMGEMYLTFCPSCISDWKWTLFYIIKQTHSMEHGWPKLEMMVLTSRILGPRFVFF